MKSKKGKSTFDVCNILFFLIMIFIMLFPIYNVIITSIITSGEYYSKPIILIPKQPTLDAYRYIFSSDQIPRALLNTVFITVVGTLLSMFFTLMLAYGLSKDFLPGRKFFMRMIILTMFFNGGLIPFYFLVKAVGLNNNIFVNIFPSLIVTWNFIIIRTFFTQIPKSLEEAALIDGASYLDVFIKVILPISKPMIATFILFYGVGYWNTWYNSMLFVTNEKIQPLQLLLRRMVVNQEKLWSMSENYATSTGSRASVYPESIKMATCVVAIVPIVCVYPFLQKYFAKGVMIGSIKG